MTIKQYKAWLQKRIHECIPEKSLAYKECLDLCPDSFEPDTERLNREAESKVQSVMDKMDNLKKQLKESKERAENGWERVRYLERKLRDVESLNDQLLRELARRQCNEHDMVSELLRLQPEEANGVE